MSRLSISFYKRAIVLVVFVLFAIRSVGQTKQQPVDLSQAVSMLDSDCPDSLKEKIKATRDEDLRMLGYPWGGSYKTIFEWTTKDSKAKLRTYLSRNGVSAHQDIIILIAFKRYLLAQSFDERTLLKPYQDIERKWDEEDRVRYSTDTLGGIYIPKDLEDCYRQINSFWNDTTKLMVKQWTEDEFIGNAHLGFGMWMRNNWQLWRGSRLSKYFNDMGINHPDDMSGIVLTSYHRQLNSKDVKINEQIQYYINYWETVKDGNKKKNKRE